MSLLKKSCDRATIIYDTLTRLDLKSRDDHTC